MTLTRVQLRDFRNYSRADVPLLYWTGLAWAGAMSLAKDESKLTADLHLAEALERAGCPAAAGTADQVLGFETFDA